MKNKSWKKVKGASSETPKTSLLHDKLQHRLKNNAAKEDKKAEAQVPKGEKRKNRHQRVVVIASAVAALTLVIGVSVWAICSHKQEPEVAEVVEEPEPEPEEELPIENTDDLVEEPEITDNNAYQVAAHKPRYLSIPSIGLHNIPVIEIGIDGNTLGDPNNERLVGWHYRSAIPGQPGVAMIDGHGGDLGTGIFKTLPRARVGDNIIVEMGDGRKFTYRIVEMVNKVRGEEANKYMHTAYQSPVPGAAAMTLITCTGKWLKNEQTYLLRLFVRAVMVE